MAEIEQKTSVQLPETLRRQFAELEGRLWRSETAVALCLALGGLAASYLVLFVSDRIWETPRWLRLLITGIGWMVASAAVVRWVYNWTLKRRDFRAFADIVQRKYRKLGDRLLGIVELADEDRRPAHFSPALYRAAIEQVAADAAVFDFRDAVSLRRARVHALSFASLGAVVIVAAMTLPLAGWNTFWRWANPIAAIPRFTLVTLEGFPREKIVAHGEPFELTGTAEYHSFWRPQRATAQYEHQPAVEAEIRGNQIRLKLPGQVQRGRLVVRVGDAKREVMVLPTHRPSLKDFAASIELPQYLQYPKVSERVQNGALTVVEGSRVAFEGQASRALTAAFLKMEGGDTQSIEVRGDKFSTPGMSLDGLLECGFTWKDELGLDSLAPWRLVVQTQKDFAPRPELPGLNREIAMLETEVLELKALAEDDFGVRELGLRWELISDVQKTNDSPRRTFTKKAKSSQEKKLEHTFNFSPALFNVPPDSSIELRAFATDFFTNRAPTESSAYRVHVLGNERHAEMMRQKLEALLARLEEVTRLEEKIAANTRELKDLPQDKMNEEKATERISESKQEQAQNAAQLEQLSREGIKLLREAFRNPLMPAQTLRDWARNVQEMQNLAEGKMQQAADSLQSAQQKSASRSQDLAGALEQEQESLQTLERMQKKINEGLDDLQALTLAQRLRKVGQSEKDIGGQLQKNIADTIGLLARDLPPLYQKANQFLASDQSGAQRESEGLQREISRFFERTQQGNYGDVSREMGEVKTGEELEKVRGLIEENIAMEAMQGLNSWSRRFQQWAEKLEPKEKAGGGGGGGGGGSGSELANQLMQELLALLRLREGELSLRARTDLLESQKDDRTVYEPGAKRLSAAQRNLLKNLMQLQMDNPVPPLQEPLKEIFDPMHDAWTKLARPQTDAETIQTQTRAIELLSDTINLINEQMQRGGQSQKSSSQEMAFLLQMMSPENGPNQGMSLSRNPGGNTSGGNTDRPAAPLEGDARGNKPETRSVDKASGVIQNFPTEFRDALENYFNAIERESP